jgi:hypothetical protein
MPRISQRNLQRFTGRRLFLAYEPLTKPVLERGIRSEKILRKFNGIGFANYLELGGSVIRLARLAREGSVIEA